MTVHLDRPRYLIPMAILVGALWGSAVGQLANVFNPPVSVPRHAVVQDMGERASSSPAVRRTPAAYNPTPTRHVRKHRTKPVRPSQAVVMPSSANARTSVTPTPAASTTPPVAETPTSDPTHTDETDHPVTSEPEAPEVSTN